MPEIIPLHPTDAARWLPQLAVGEGQKPGAYERFGPLAGHLRFVERSSRKLARSTFYAMGRWQAKLEKKQAFLGRIVDIGAELFAIAYFGRFYLYPFCLKCLIKAEITHHRCNNRILLQLTSVFHRQGTCVHDLVTVNNVPFFINRN
jgi:hypothetical protein